MELTWLGGLLVGVPMVVVLLLTFFRVDEAWTCGPKLRARKPLAGGTDRNGMPIFVDPDGNSLGRTATHEEYRRWQRRHRPGDWVSGSSSVE